MTIWKSDVFIWLYHLDSNEIPGEKARWKLHKNTEMDQNMILKEKWVYEEKASSYKKWLQIIYNSYI